MRRSRRSASFEPFSPRPQPWLPPYESKGDSMIAVFVTFESDRVDEARVRKIAAEARGMFDGMEGLRNKIFTIDETKRSTRNVYLWESEEAARDFFSEPLLARVTDLYGVR